MATQYTPNYALPYPELLDPTPGWTIAQQTAMVSIDSLIKTREDDFDVHIADHFAHAVPETDIFVVDAIIEVTKQVALSSAPLSETESVEINGLGQVSGLAYDYTLVGNLVTFTAGVTLTIGDTIRVIYAGAP